ncbi:MAG TPA: ABC transporter substrate-binding protein [Pseudolabrys sp.]|nr:ABC transporter substrate-binding protein [Pseudolabrys sp.]
MNHFCRKSLLGLAVGLAMGTLAAPTFAANLQKVTVISTHRGVWDQTLIEWGMKQGFFKDEGLDIHLIWAGGGSDTVQMLVSGTGDIAIGNGFDSTIAAFSQGAPVNVISAEKTGAQEFYWYSKVGSGIKNMKEAAGKKMGFSHPGSSTHMVAAALANHAGVKVDLIPTGEMSANLTAVMSGQIGLGWAAVPFGLKQEKQGEIQTVASGRDLPDVTHQTIRVDIASRSFIKAHKDAVKHFLAAYQKTLDWAYKSEDAVKNFAKVNKVSLDIAKEALKRGYPKSSLVLYPVSGVEKTMQQAVKDKLIKKPLSKDQVHELLQYTELAPH